MAASEPMLMWIYVAAFLLSLTISFVRFVENLDPQEHEVLPKLESAITPEIQQNVEEQSRIRPQLELGIEHSGHQQNDKKSCRSRSINKQKAMEITIYEAQLKKSYGLFAMDLYCTVTIGTETFRTKKALSRIGKDTNPIWNECFVCDLRLDTTFVNFQIFDQNIYKSDDFIASAIHELSDEIYSGKEMKGWLNLSGRLGERKEGVLMVKLKLLDEEQLQRPETVCSGEDLHMSLPVQLSANRASDQQTAIEEPVALLSSLQHSPMHTRQNDPLPKTGSTRTPAVCNQPIPDRQTAIEEPVALLSSLQHSPMHTRQNDPLPKTGSTRTPAVCNQPIPDRQTGMGQPVALLSSLQHSPMHSRQNDPLPKTGSTRIPADQPVTLHPRQQPSATQKAMPYVIDGIGATVGAMPSVAEHIVDATVSNIPFGVGIAFSIFKPLFKAGVSIGTNVAKSNY